jgi:iron complex outermembrane receptor protein
MVSGIFNGLVNPYSLIDLTASYDIRRVQGLRLVFSANNLLDFRHREFVGAPDIGRMTTLRAAYSF